MTSPTSTYAADGGFPLVDRSGTEVVHADITTWITRVG